MTQAAQHIDITIGKPIANTQIYILDKYLQPVPIGVAGELCIAGDGVGLGYLNRPDLTAERFLPNPFATEENHHGKTMYRTGDLARWRTDGEIEYLGRIDTQVKIRGLRIELGEIESVMSSFSGVKMCVVSDKKDKAGRQYLVGYYVSEDEIDEGALRGALSAKLPKYMVPNKFMRLQQLPMTASGKVDRKNLPEPDSAVLTEADRDIVAPQNEIESELLSLWKRNLGLDEISTTDDYFDLGGDSLLAISLVGEIEEKFSFDVSVKSFFAFPTIQKFAAHIAAQSREDLKPVKLSRNRYLATEQQQAVYAFCMKYPGALTYNMPFEVPLSDRVDRQRLTSAIEQLVRIYPAFRTSFILQDGEVYGTIHDTVDFSVERISEHERTAFVRSFSLDHAPLIRAAMTQDRLLLDMHHIIADGASMNLILYQLLLLYERKPDEPESYDYADFAEYLRQYQNTKLWREGKTWFEKHLCGGVEALQFPTPMQRQDSGGREEFYTLEPRVYEVCTQLCRQYKISETMLFMAAYGILLSRYTRSERVTSSVILTNRVRQEFRETVGMFVNTLPCQYPNMDEMTTAEYLDGIKQMVLQLYEYQFLSLREVAECAQIDPNQINTSFVYQANEITRFDLEGEPCVPQPIYTKTAKFDLMMEIAPMEEAYRIRIEYRADKVSEQTVKRMLKSYELILLELAAKENIRSVEVIPEMESHKIVNAWNDTYVTYPREKCVHELFMEQAGQTPEQTALVFEEQEFTYRQLDEMSNALAHLLRDKGIGRGDIVPIISVRSWHIIVAMLGILKAGGAYMPISPDYPKERIDYILEQAKSKLVLMYGCRNEDYAVDVMELGDLANHISSEAPCNLNQSSDPCYVIFTSGSTGTPKGTVSTHGNVVNYSQINMKNPVFFGLSRLGCRSVVSVTNYIFDIFVTESLLPLVNGMTVIFANDEEAVSQPRLAQLFAKREIDVLQTTPTKMRSFLVDWSNTGYLQQLKAIILGGEAFPSELYGALRACTDAKIYNIYGPAETTVWSTNAEIEP